ncbi:acyltransferase family protein [Lysinibacillus cavernae]|uniref:acyltransferase family protein n=1 Tax=Lysinibacillus cavernae TaxID=2666135 RepID=UPI0012D9C8CC|nr:acyltransferase family protein [Lysinibacillus cavernae]
MGRQPHNHRHISGLDGLRALAVSSVIFYHFNFQWAKGGFLGVDIFFVLSGYLITSTILPVEGDKITVNLRKFWINRFRRLIPAVYFMVISIFIWVILFNPELINKLRGDALASFFYSSNWWFIFHKTSYFDSFGSPSPLKNLWSLAIEEQFYLLWPVILLMGLFILKKQSKFSIFVMMGAIYSAILMSLLYVPGNDPSRIYYGTDTRVFELLIGCWLALIWSMKRLSSKKLSDGHIKKLNIISFISLTIIILSICLVDEYQTFLYRGGMFLFCINAAILIACVCHPSSLLSKLLSFKPLCWIGSRSYGIYLWHYPVIVLGTPIQEIGNLVFWRFGLLIALTLIIAEFSYRYIEMPIKKNGFGLYIRWIINHLKWKDTSIVHKLSTVFFVLISIMFIAGITGLIQNEQSETLKSSQEVVKINSDRKTDASTNAIENSSRKITQENDVNQDSENKIAQENKQDKESSKLEQNERSAKTFKGILAIGDSVMINIAPNLTEIYPNITIDAKVGRQMSQAAQIASNYSDYNDKDKAVIIQLGTNGYFTDTQLDSLLNTFSNANVYLVNTRVPRPWEDKVNDALIKKAKQNNKVTLIDWYSVAIGHPEYFAKDGVHLVSKGTEILSNLIRQTIKK